MSVQVVLGLIGAAILAWVNRKKLSSGAVTVGRAVGTTSEEPIVLVFRDLRAVAQRCDEMRLDEAADKIRSLAAEILAAEANLANAATPSGTATAPAPAPTPTP